MAILTRSSSCHQPNYYQLLSIDPSASLKDIEKAYRRQALIHHPDRNPNQSQNQSTGNFQKIAEAYEVLRDPIKRIKYDLKLSKSAMDRETARSSTSNLYANPPSNRRTKDSNRSPTLDLFGYPGEIPRYVPALHRRSASTTPPFLFRQSSSQPTDPIHPKDPNPPRASGSSHVHAPLSFSPSSIYPESHQPFSQKIKLKDLDSLKLNINLVSSRPRAPPSEPNDHHQRSQTRSHSLNHPLCGVAPDPYLTFERAWGKNLDDIIDGIVDREIEQNKHLRRKSPTDPLPIDPKPRVVHRSSTVRSADSEYRPSAHDHSQRRPRSASGDRIRDAHQFSINRGGPHSVPIQLPREMSSPRDDMKPYLPPPSNHIRSRRMSTGHEGTFNSGPVLSPHGLYRPMNNSETSSSSSSVPFVRDRTNRHSMITSPTIQPFGSPQEMPFFPHSNLESNPRRASTFGLGKEFREVIIRFERETDGSTRLSKEMKSRTIDSDGTIHDRYRRQRSAAVN